MKILFSLLMVFTLSSCGMLLNVAKDEAKKEIKRAVTEAAVNYIKDTIRGSIFISVKSGEAEEKTGGCNKEDLSNTKYSRNDGALKIKLKKSSGSLTVNDKTQKKKVVIYFKYYPKDTEIEVKYTSIKHYDADNKLVKKEKKSNSETKGCYFDGDILALNGAVYKKD